MVNVRSLPRIILVMAASLALAAPSTVWSENSLPTDEKPAQQLLLERANAEALISKGEVSAAALLLIQSLRDVPSDRSELADEAFGNVQLAHFVLVYLLQDELASDMVFKQLDPNQFASDHFLQLAFQLIMAPDKQEQTRLTRALLRLTEGGNEIVSILAQFCLSTPYLNYEADFTEQFSLLLAERHPNLELTQFCQNFWLVRATKSGDLTDLAAIIEGESKLYPKGDWSEQLRNSIKASSELLKRPDGKSRSEALSPMYVSIVQAPDWRERYFALLLLRDEMDGPAEVGMRDAAREVSKREENSPDVLYAKYLLAQTLSAECAENRADQDLRAEAVEMAKALLGMRITDTSPERVIWHVRMSGIRGSAQNLAAAGHVVDALELYTELASQYPNSKIEAECNEAISAIKSVDNASE